MLANYCNCHIRGVLAGGALTALIGTAPTVASAAPEPDQSDTASVAASPEASGLSEIVVTARRREENLQKVPVAVSVLSGDELRRENISAPEDLNAHVPSLTVAGTSTERDSSIYSIRGQGQTFGGADPAVVTYFAEVPTDGTGPGSLYDLDSVQVLKGPQGTLFGRNTTGGAILLQPTKPGEEFGGYATISGGQYNLHRFQGASDLPIISNKVLARVAFDVNKRDGFSRDAVTGVQYDTRNYKAFRFSLILRPFEGLENYTVAAYTKSDASQSGTVLSNLNPTGTLATFFPNLLQYFAVQQARGVRLTESDIPNGGYQKIRSLGITNITSYNVNDKLTLKNVFGYRLFKFNTTGEVDGTPLPIVESIASPFWGSGANTTPSSRYFSDELQLQGKTFEDRLNWIGGVYYEHRKPESDTNKDVITQFFVPNVIQSLKRDTSKAIFGQVTYAISPDLKITTGARYTKDDRAQDASNYVLAKGPVAGCTFPIPVPNCVASNSASFHALTGNVSLDYQAAQDTLLYAAVRRGYKSGGFNAASPGISDRIFAPEFVTDLELGVKNQFRIGDAPGRVNLDIYRGNFKDQQENGTILDQASGQLLTLTRNAGRGHIQGLEIDALVRPVRWFTLSGSFAYTDPKYTENSIAGIDLTNRPFYNVPKTKFSITPEVEFGLSDRVGTLFLSGTYTHQSQVYFTEGFFPTIANPLAGQRGYGLLNLRASLKDIGGIPLEVSVFGTNVTNKDYKIFEFDAWQLLGSSHAIYGEPRMWGVDVRYSFGGSGHK
jgi:iron complex outermembrane receptor protein